MEGGMKEDPRMVEGGRKGDRMRQERDCKEGGMMRQGGWKENERRLEGG
jgi:hypothetical protein